jgi:hypothetical protein
LGLEGEFFASVGWLARFKQQYGINEIAVQGERLSANDATADRFHIEFQKFVHEENLKLDQIYNSDESGICWEVLPTRTVAFEREKCAPRHKSSKAHLTVVLWKCVRKSQTETCSDCSRLLKQTASLTTITTIKEHGWIGRFLKICSTCILF